MKGLLLLLLLVLMRMLVGAAGCRCHHPHHHHRRLPQELLQMRQACGTPCDGFVGGVGGTVWSLGRLVVVAIIGPLGLFNKSFRLLLQMWQACGTPGDGCVRGVGGPCWSLGRWSLLSMGRLVCFNKSFWLVLLMLTCELGYRGRRPLPQELLQMSQACFRDSLRWFCYCWGIFGR